MIADRFLGRGHSVTDISIGHQQGAAQGQRDRGGENPFVIIRCAKSLHQYVPSLAGLKFSRSTPGCFNPSRQSQASAIG
jgi:hypothetical protein